MAGGSALEGVDQIRDVIRDRGVAVPLVVYDGRLVPENAALFSRKDGALLLARRENAAAAAWEVTVLQRFLTRAPLLPSEAPPRELEVASIADLVRAVDLVRALLAEAGASGATEDVASDVVYELGANALLDAPVDAAGQPRYAHRRHESPEIDPADACRMQFALDGELLYVCANDRFGRLTPEPIARTISGLGQRARVDPSGGGAGLGLRRLLDNGELLAARVVEGRSTEVLSVVSMSDVRRRAAGLKSVFFLTERE